MGVFVLVSQYGWSLPWCQGANLGVFDLCHVDLPKRGCASLGESELVDLSKFQARIVSQEKGAQTQAFGSGYLLVGWGSST